MKTVSIQLTEEECQEMARIFDLALRAEGLRIVPLVSKFIDRMNQALNNAQALPLGPSRV